MVSMSTKLFIFNIQSFSDIVTNSSSELFVFSDHNRTEENIIQLLNSIYPDWGTEYYCPVQVNCMSDIDLNTYLSQTYNTYDWNQNVTKQTSNQTSVAKYFGLNPVVAYENYDNWDPTSDDYSKRWIGPLTKSALDIIRGMIPDTEFALYSIEDNPDPNYQEVLSKYAIRYHLG